jgi:putative colanic acid biosynthesis glycosyltransferase
MLSRGPEPSGTENMLQPDRSASRNIHLAVITVCLNDLDGLKKTYASVRAQTRQPCQWIVADGDSSDGTVDWLRQLHWEPLSFSSQVDGGIYEGMNHGLQCTDADYVLFLNSGDLLAGVHVLESVEKELAALQPGPALLFGDSFEVDRWSRPNLRRARPAWWVWLGMPTTHQAMFFRRDALPTGFDTRYRLSGDYAAVCALYRRGAKFHHLALPIAHFHLGGRSDQQRQRFLRENLEIRRRLLRMPVLPALVLHLAHCVHGWIKYHLPSLHGLVRYG